jgi:hypothetical protein
MIVFPIYSITELRWPRDGINPQEVEIYSLLNYNLTRLQAPNLAHTDVLKCDANFFVDGSTWNMQNLTLTLETWKFKGFEVPQRTTRCHYLSCPNDYIQYFYQQSIYSGGKLKTKVAQDSRCKTHMTNLESDFPCGLTFKMFIQF